MPNDDELIAREQDRGASAGKAELGRWMRVPEAWAALRALDPSEVDGIQSPFDLAALIEGRADETSIGAAGWRELERTTVRPPSDFHGVLGLASALRQGMDAGFAEEIADAISARPDVWRSAMAMAWPGLSNRDDIARHLVARGGPAGASLLANALLASCDRAEAAATLRQLLGEGAPDALSVLLQAGEGELAAEVAAGLAAPKAAQPSGEAALAAAARSLAEGAAPLARQTLIAGWDRTTELGATFGDRLADVALAENDPVSACEAIKRAVQLQPSRERKARVAALLAEMGRTAEANDWLAGIPETAAEYIAAAAVRLQAGDRGQAASHVAHAVASLQSEPGLQPEWLLRLSAAAQSIGHAHLAVPVLERLARRRPEDVEARYLLALNLLAVGEPDEAAAHALVACGMKDDSADARRLLARSLQAAGRPGQALPHWSAIPDATNEDRLEAAQCAMLAGAPASAIDIATHMLASQPGSAPAMSLLGRALLVSGQPAKALPHLEAACAADPRQPDTWKALAECQAATGDLQASGMTLAAAIQAAPGNGGLLHAYAAWLRDEGRTSEALDASAQAATASEAPVEWRLEYGELLVALGHFELAAQVLHATLAVRPASWPTRRALAEALIGVGKTPEAADVVSSLGDDADAAALAFAGRVLALQAEAARDQTLARRAITLLERSQADVPSPETEVWLAKALETCHEVDRAYELFRSALEDPDALQPEVHLAASLGLARCATALHRPPAAIRALETATAVHGPSADVEIALSAAYAASGQHHRSLEAAQRASELAPGEASLRQLTQAAAQAGETGLALEAVRKLTELQPSNPHVWLSVAELSAQAQDLPDARHALATGIRLAHDDASAWSRASDLLLRHARPMSAQRALRRALSCAPSDPDLVRQMAEVSQHAGDNLTAQRAWTRFAELQHQDPAGLKLAARSLSQLGQRAVAIGVWQRAVSLDPQDTDAQSDLARAYLTEGDAARALAHYRSVTSALPGDLGLTLEAAAAELHYGSPDAAVELYRTAAQQAPQETAAWLGLGEGLLMLSRPHEARPALEAAYRLDSSRVQTMGALAIAALDTGDAPMAAAIYQSAQRHTCENAPAAAALARAALALLQWDEALLALDHMNASAPSLASLRAAVEIRLRLADAAWLFQSASAHMHAPDPAWLTDSAWSDVNALLDQLAGVAPSWVTDRLRQRASVTYDRLEPASVIESARMDPSGETLEGLAIALLRKGRPADAYELVTPGVGVPCGRWQHLLAGLALIEMGQLEPARQALHEATSDAAMRPLAEFLAARTYLHQGDPEAFASRVSDALVEWNDEAAWHFELANAYLQIGQPDAALPHLHQASELAPSVGDYSLALARTALQAGDLAGAQAGFSRAVEDNPAIGVVWKEAGLCALANDDPATADAWLEHARRLLPGDVETLVAAARASLALDDVRQAHQHAQAAYHIAPDDADVLQALGEVFARQGKLDRALQSFDRALKHAADPLPVHVARSRLLVYIGRAEQAVATLKTAIAQAPESDAGWAALAEIEEAAGNLPEALDASSRAVQLSPHSLGHRMQLGRLCRKTGQLDRALDELLRAQGAGRSDGTLSFEIGRVYEERREFKRSLDAYQRTIDLDSSHGEAHFRAGVVLKLIKAYPQAGKMLKRAVELNPKDPEALHQLAAVRALELVHGGIAQQVVAP
jgi:tetratricopeptide (TPR) repeat protein